MPAPIAIFFEFNLPNATTWFYFSFLLAMALFFKFSRLLSVRNLDVCTVFLLVPGLLIVQNARPQPVPVEISPAVQIASLIGKSALPTAGIERLADGDHLTRECGRMLENARWLWFGYLWLIVGSIYFLLRCLLDLALVQRPQLGPNLQVGGMAWLAGAMMICMLAVAYRQAERYLNPGFPATNQPLPVLLLHPSDQAIFGVAVLWWDWPTWAITGLAVLCHCAVAVGLAWMGWRHFQDMSAGMAAATLYLLLPYTGFSVGLVHHVLPMVLFLSTLLAYRRPTLAGCLLGITTAATYFPLFTLPLWLSFYRDRGIGRFLFAFFVSLAAVLGLIAALLWAHGELESSTQIALDSAAWQPWKVPTTEGFWTGVHWAYRIPVFLLFMSFVFGTMFWPSPKNLAHVIALSAAIFISVQLWSAEQGGLYMMWYIPLVVLMIFRPNLKDRVPPTIDPESDWLTGIGRSLMRTLRRLLKRPEPITTTAAGPGR